MSAKSSTRGTVFPAPDLVDVVEALYAPGLSWDEWLRVVGDRIRPLTDRYDLGVGGLLFTCPDPCSFLPTRALHCAVPDRIVAITFEGFRALPPAYVADQYLGTVYRSSECRGYQDLTSVKDGSAFAAGYHDGLLISVAEPDGFGCWFASPQSARAPISDELHLALTRVRRHLAAAFRLRRRHSDGLSPESAEAVIDEHGQVQHAEDAAKEKAPRAALLRAMRQMNSVRRSAPGSDARRNIHEWQSVVLDRWSLVEHVDTDGKRLTLAVDNRPAPPSIELLSEREREVVLWAAAGHENKVIAYELGLSASTVRVLMSRAAAKIGVRSRNELLEKVARLRPFGA